MSVILLTATACATADETGLLVLTSQAPDFDQASRTGQPADIDCDLWRHGQIGGSRGTLDLGEASFFSLISCQGVQTERPEQREQLRRSFGLPADAIILEGGFRNREAEFTAQEQSSDRHYVIKVGAFNNSDPDARQVGHAQFMSTAGSRPHAFSIEAVIDVERAVGMPTPDTVEIFYYFEEAEARRFGRANEDILTASHAFNAAHFDRYVYFGGLAPSAQSSPPIVTSQSEEPVVSLDYKSGQVLSFVMPESKPDGETAVAEYNERIRRIARSVGLTNDVRLDVDRRIVGDFEGTNLSILSWPDETSVQRFASHPEWPAIKLLRQEGWTDLRIYSDVLETDLSLQFDPAKFYTLAIAWLNPERPDDYSRYFELIDADVAAAGGRFMYKMLDPTFETHTLDIGAPGQLTLVEWESEDSLATLQSSETYKQASALFKSGVTHFEFYVIEPAEGDQ